MKLYAFGAAAALLLAFPGTAPAQAVNPEFVQSGTGARARAFLDKVREQHVSVKDFGAKCDGSSNDSAAIAAAARAAAGKSLRFPACASAYRIASALTLTGTVVFDAGAVVAPDRTITLTLNGEIFAPATSQIFSGGGNVLISRTANPTVRALWFAGADIGAQINAAVAAVERGPAVVKVGAGSYRFITTINLTDSTGIRLTSDSGNLNVNGNVGPVLMWTGGAGSGGALKAPGSRAFEFDHLNLTYNNAGYNGSLLSLSSTGGANNTANAHIHHARIAGQAGAAGAARLIEVNTTLNFTIDNTVLDYAVVGIGATGGSNNVISIGDGMWFDKHFTDAVIRAWGANWRFGNFVAESDPTNGVLVTTFLKLAGNVSGISFNGGLFVDGGNAGGTFIDLRDSTSSGISLNGVVGAANNGTFLMASILAGATSGLSVQGCAVVMAVGFNLGRADAVTITGNDLNRLSTPWTGLEPTRYFIDGNNTGGTNTSGVIVGNNSSIAISRPGSSNDGAGLISIWVTEEAGGALYMLNGSAGTTTEISDSYSIFSTTQATASSLNIYWDARTKAYRLENKRGGNRTVTVTGLR